MEYQLNPYLYFFNNYLFNSLTKKLFKLELEEINNLNNPKNIKHLLKNKIIFKDKNSLRNFLFSFCKKTQDPYFFESLHIIPTNSCNLRCKYCFVYHGKNPKKIINQNFEEIKKTIKLFFDKNTCKEPLITFYGGEPLLRPDFIFQCLDYIEKKLKKKVKKRIITNGILVTSSIAKRIKKYDIEVAVSIDGKKDVHDNKRRFLENSGSFDYVLKGYNLLKKNNIRVNILCAVGDHNIKSLEEHIAFLCTLQPNAIAINLPRELPGGSLRKNIDENLIIEKYVRCLKILYDKQIPELNFLKLIKGFLDKEIVFRPCSACGSQMAISPDNFIGPCQAFVNSKKYFVNAKYFTNKDEILNNKNFKYWGSINKSTSETCFECSIMPICMDDCPMDRKNFNSSFFIPTQLQCKFRKKMIEFLIERIINNERFEFKK
jgi:uncharacterized protein